MLKTQTDRLLTRATYGTATAYARHRVRERLCQEQIGRSMA
jgi:hypothetical protein